MQPCPSWGSGTRGGTEIKKEPTCLRRRGAQLGCSRAWAGLDFWFGEGSEWSSPLTGQIEEPP